MPHDNIGAQEEAGSKAEKIIGGESEVVPANQPLSIEQRALDWIEITAAEFACCFDPNGEDQRDKDGFKGLTEIYAVAHIAAGYCTGCVERAKREGHWLFAATQDDSSTGPNPRQSSPDPISDPNKETTPQEDK